MKIFHKCLCCDTIKIQPILSGKQEVERLIKNNDSVKNMSQEQLDDLIKRSDDVNKDYYRLSVLKNTGFESIFCEKCGFYTKQMLVGISI